MINGTMLIIRQHKSPVKFTLITNMIEAYKILEIEQPNVHTASPFEYAIFNALSLFPEVYIYGYSYTNGFKINDLEAIIAWTKSPDGIQ